MDCNVHGLFAVLDQLGAAGLSENRGVLLARDNLALANENLATFNQIVEINAPTAILSTIDMDLVAPAPGPTTLAAINAAGAPVPGNILQGQPPIRQPQA